MNVMLLHSNHWHVSATLKMATWVAKTWRWSLCNKITFINPSAVVGLCNKCYVKSSVNKIAVWHFVHQESIFSARNQW